MSKKYVMASYDVFSNTGGVVISKGIAMYEYDDFRLEKKNKKVNGTFELKRDIAKMVKGVFHGDNGIDYEIYNDHSAVRLSDRKHEL